MSLIHVLRRLIGRRAKDKDLVMELESHLGHEIDDNLTRGMSPEDARRRAYAKLGNPLVIRDQVWEAHPLKWLEDGWRDLRFAARTLRKTPTFTFVAVLVMALGIGANTSIYSFLDALLWRSLPVSDPGSLVVLNWHAKSQGDSVMESMSGWTEDDPKLGLISGIFPYPAFELFQKDNAAFFDVFAHCASREVRPLNVVIGGQAETASGDLVSGNYFQGLGIVPFAGRLIVPDDDRIGGPAVAVISHSFNEKHFSGTNAAGQSILINNLPFTVIGVAPPEFFGVDPARSVDVYLPMHTNVVLGAQIPFGFKASDYLDSHFYWVEVMARLRPGIPLARAQAELASRFQPWVASTARNDQQRANLPVLYLKEAATGLDTLRRQFSKPLYVLMVLVGLILAIACSNIANLMLARGTSRKREIALRMSEGASRLRILRQLLTESILLATIGGAFGVLLAVWGIRLLTTLVGEEGGRALNAELNLHVLGVAAGLTLLTGVLFGLAPAFQSAKLDLISALKETRAGDSRRHSQWRISISQVLVMGQIAISLLLLVAAGLFLRTLANLQSIPLGFNRENLLLFELNAHQTGHKDPEILQFYASLRDRFAALPGVRNAGLAQGSLIRGESRMPISLPGLPPAKDTRYLPVGPDFFTTMQIPIVAGRDINDRDGPGSQPVALINEEFARLNFQGQNPLGHHLLLWQGADEKKLLRDMEIIGVSNNARYGGLRRGTVPVVYLGYNQGFPQPDQMMFVIRTSGDPLGFVNAVREVVRQADPHLPVSSIRTQKSEIRDSMHQGIMLAELCSAFAILALTIACVGLYGTISYGVVRRTGQIGIRMALGAQRGPVLWMVLREVLTLAGAGLAISFPIALGTSKFVASLLFDMKPNDPRALAFAVTILAASSLLAGWIPAWRASHIDPMTALRHE